MKYIMFFILMFSVEVHGQTATTPIAYDYTYEASPIPAWYHNLEKYWYYRYRLVNDFLFIDPADGAGSSIPAQDREQYPAKPYNETPPGSAPLPLGSQTLKWADATIDLGHYIDMLALEDQVGQLWGWSTNRTEYELQHALSALGRLDVNAEEYEYEISNNIGPYQGYMGQLLTSGTHYDYNGYFIRDDVPYLTLLDPTWPSNQYKHFNRPGLQGTWTYTLAPTWDVMTTADAETRTRWEGTIDGKTEPTSTWPAAWSYGGTPRYPCQESLDQLVDIDLGLALTQRYSQNSVLQTQASDMLFRTINYPFSSYYPQIHNYEGSCVYGINPSYSCSTAGADVWPEAIGLSAEALYFGDNFFPSSVLYARSTADPVMHLAWTLSALSATLINCATEGNGLQFPANYAATTNTWGSLTYLYIEQQSDAGDWNAPHLPLVNELYLHFRHNHRTPDYENAFTAVPECGTFNFSGYQSPDGDYPYNDQVAATPYMNNWTGNDWLSEPEHRKMTCATAAGSNFETYNGLDYMTLFNLYSVKQTSFDRYSFYSSSYLQGYMNSYWCDNFNCDYPDPHGFGRSSNPIKLDFLQYVAVSGMYDENAAVKMRVGYQMDMNQGFWANPSCANCYADFYVQDYRCDQDMPYHFAYVANPSLCATCPAAPPGADDSSSGDTTLHFTYTPIAYYKTTTFAPPSPDELADSPQLENLVLDPAREKYMFDSIANLLVQTGNEKAIDYLRSLGVNVDSIIQAQDNSALYYLIVTLNPNPTNTRSYLEYTLTENSIVQIALTNEIGQKLDGCIDPYLQEQPAGDYKIGINVERLQPGLYIVDISINGHLFSKKLTVLN